MNQLAKLVGDLATGEAEEVTQEPANEAARKRGDARGATLTPKQRTETARMGAEARWSKVDFTPSPEPR